MGDSIVLFGGYSKRGGQYFNDLYRLDLTDAEWTKVHAMDQPPARVDHSMVAFNEQVYIFGGFKDKLRFKDMQKFSFSTKRWSEIALEGDPPQGRVGHTAVMYGYCMFVFGGWSGRDTLDDLHEFNCTSEACRQIVGRGAAPNSRYRHSAAVYDKSMFVFGGTSKSQQRFADLFEFNFDLETWTEVNTVGGRPSPRTFHCAEVCHGRMFVFGGFDGQRLNDLYSIMINGEHCGSGLKAAGGALSKQGLGGALAQQASRIMDVDETPRHLAPVKGLGSVPLMSLMDATVHLITSLVGLQGCVATAMRFAHERTSRQGPDPYGLTEDMVACIYLYTTEVVFGALNSCLRSENREGVKRFFPFLRLLLASLQRLPSYSGIVYRGSKKDLSKSYTIGQSFSLWSFQSATTDENSLRNDAFLGNSGSRSLLCLEITGGKDISMYSAFAEEKEILIPAGCTFKVEEAGPGEERGLVKFSIRQISPSELLPNGGLADENSSKKCCSIQ